MIWPDYCIASIDPGCCSSWGISSSITSLITVPDGIFFPLLLSPPKLFRPYFSVTNLWVYRALRYLRFLGKLLLGISSKFFRNSMDNIYCKKNYSKGEGNVVEITQIRLQEMKKNVAMASFYYLVMKIWKNKMCCFLSTKN